MQRRGDGEQSLDEVSEPGERSVDDYKGKETVVLFLSLLVGDEKQSSFMPERGEILPAVVVLRKTQEHSELQERDEKAGEQKRNKAELAASKEIRTQGSMSLKILHQLWPEQTDF